MMYTVTLKADEGDHVLQILTDEDLSYLAKGLAAFMFEKQAKLTSTQIEATSNREAIEAALNELEDAGHLIRITEGPRKEPPENHDYQTSKKKA